MYESQEKSNLSYLRFLPFRYDSKAGFIISVLIFLILNIITIVFIMNITAFASIGDSLINDMSFLLYDGLIIGTVAVTVILIFYLPVVLYKNLSKCYNIKSLFSVIILINYGSVIFFSFLWSS